MDRAGTLNDASRRCRESTEETLMREMDHRLPLPQATVLPASSRNVTTYLQALYRALLHRPAMRGEIEAGASALRAGARTRLVTELFHRDDALARIVHPLYAGLLGRAASADEITAGIAALRCGMSLDKLVASIASSDEYASCARQRHPHLTPTAALIVACYNDLLQRMPSDLEGASAVEQLASGRRDAWLLSVLRSV